MPRDTNRILMRNKSMVGRLPEREVVLDWKIKKLDHENMKEFALSRLSSNQQYCLDF